MQLSDDCLMMSRRREPDRQRNRENSSRFASAVSEATGFASAHVHTHEVFKVTDPGNGQEVGQEVCLREVVTHSYRLSE